MKNLTWLIGAIDPVAFRIGSLEVMWYGVIIAIGMIIGVTIAEKEANRLGFREDFLTDGMLWTIPLGFVGARLYYVMFNPSYYIQNPEKIIAIWEGGLAIYGGLIAGSLVLAWYTKKENRPLSLVFDAVAPGVMFAQALGRWGNFMNQEAHGGEVTRVFLEKLKLPNFIIEGMYIDGEYYHPTFLYESVWNLIGLVIILILRRKEGFFKRGEVALAYIGWYSFGRFFIEGMRTDSLYFLGTPIRVSQLLAVILFFFAVGLVIYRRRNTFRLPDYSEGLKPEFLKEEK